MNRRGMTLLEVTLALALFGMLAAFLLGIIDSVLGLWQAGERRGRGDLVFAAATERLRADVRAMHTGSEGWLVIDDYEALPEADGRPAWRLPRLRFLADGAGLPADDPSGRSAVEVAWVFVPEDRSASRLTRLVRWTRIDEGAGEGFEIDRVMGEVQRGGDGLVVLDGVAWGRFLAFGMDSEADVDVVLDVPSFVPYGFPSALRVEIERVSGNARNRAPTLDDALSVADGVPLTLRGTAPLRQPEYVLVGEEWIRVTGNFPNLQASRRGERATLAGEHQPGDVVYLPEAYASEHALPDGGRRHR